MALQRSGARMKLHYDPKADAASVEVDGPADAERIAFLEELDRDRKLRLDAAGSPVEYEFLNVRRWGVRLDDLEHRDELSRLFQEAGFSERSWSSPRPVTEKRHRAG
jgi:hypothetical protein